MRRRRQFSAGFQHFANFGHFQRPVHGRGVSSFHPTDLGLLGYYDVHASGSATEIADSSGNSLAATAFAAAGNSPLYLAYSDTPYAYLPGLTGNTITTPVTAGIHNAGGDVELVMHLNADDFTPAASQAFFSCFPGNTGGWEFRMPTSGVDNFIPHNGTTGTAHAATTGPSLTDGTWYWRRMVYDADTGAGQYGLDFYKANTQADEPSSWTQVGTTVTATSVVIASPGATNAHVGSRGNTNLLVGRVSRAIVRAGVGGATGCDWKAVDCTQSGVTDSASNVWTINRAAAGRKTVILSPAAKSARSIALFGTDDYATAPAAAIPSMGASDPWSIVLVIRQHDTPTNFGRYLSTKLSTGLGKGIAIRTNGTGRQIACHFGDGTNAVDSFGPSAAAAGVVQVIVVSCTGPQVTVYVNGAPGTPVDVSSVGDRATGQMQVGRDAGSSSNYQDFELIAYGTASKALSAGNALQLSRFFQGGA